MWANYESNVKATIAFLKLLKVKVNNATVDETLQSHPDWPSLLCISDSLNKWNIPNAAGKIDKNDIEQLPLPFIAYTHNREYPLAIVTNVADDFVYYSAKGYKQNELKVSNEEFRKIWDGVYLIAEPTNVSGEKKYTANKKIHLIKKLIPASVLAAFILFFGYTLYQSATVTEINNWAVYLQFGLLLAGVGVTALLLWYETDKNNAALKKVCTGIAKGNCDAILSSKQSKLFSWLSWSEIGFFYFAGSLLNLVFAGNNLPTAIVLLSWLSVLALPYTIFSIYYQWRIAKQWCILCLAVQLLLVLGALHSFIFYQFQPISVIPLFVFALFFLLALSWYAVKPLLFKLQKAKTEKREYLRLKFNTEIFDTLLKKQKHITASAEAVGISLGNPAAKNTLIKVCNPYCGPCAKAHPKIDTLLKECLDLKVKIIFNIPDKDTYLHFKPVTHFLAMEEEGNQEKIRQVLDSWYLPPKKDYAAFAAKHPFNERINEQRKKVAAMYHWCREVDIKVTPTFFLNGYQLPDAYSIEDLNYFLLDEPTLGGYGD